MNTHLLPDIYPFTCLVMCLINPLIQSWGRVCSRSFSGTNRAERRALCTLGKPCTNGAASQPHGANGDVCHHTILPTYNSCNFSVHLKFPKNGSLACKAAYTCDLTMGEAAAGASLGILFKDNLGYPGSSKAAWTTEGDADSKNNKTK